MFYEYFIFYSTGLIIYAERRYSPWRLNIQLPIVTLGAEVDHLPEEIIFTHTPPGENSRNDLNPEVLIRMPFTGKNKQVPYPMGALVT